MQGRIRTLSNALSLLRVLLVVPISLALTAGTPQGRTAAMTLILLAGATDYLDGFFARRMGQVSDLGKILDPVADKIAVGVVAVILTVQGSVPVWFLAAVVARDLAILAAGVYLTRKKSVVLQSNRLGKWTAGTLALTLFAAVAGPEFSVPVVPALLAVSAAMLAASSVSYAVRFFSELTGPPAGTP